MTIRNALARSADLSNWIDTSIHGLEIPSGDRECVAAALFDQVHEHHKAIHLLLQSSLFGSAYSLVRPAFETFVRGVWLRNCASDKEVENFTKDKKSTKSIGTLISEIEALPGYDGGVLSKFKNEAWSAMCGYAHGGFQQVVRRITPSQIAVNFSEDEMLEVINSASTLALLAAFEMFQMAKRQVKFPPFFGQVIKL